MRGAKGDTDANYTGEPCVDGVGAVAGGRVFFNERTKRRKWRTKRGKWRIKRRRITKRRGGRITKRGNRRITNRHQSEHHLEAEFHGAATNRLAIPLGG